MCPCTLKMGIRCAHVYSCVGVTLNWSPAAGLRSEALCALAARCACCACCARLDPYYMRARCTAPSLCQQA